LITPEELTNPNVDEKSVMTYLAQFPRAKPKMIGQIGEDIDRHPFVGIPTKFTIELNDQQNYQPELAIFDPFGEEIETKMTPDIQHGKYQIEFVPTVVGEYKVKY
jgi:filamin